MNANSVLKGIMQNSILKLLEDNNRMNGYEITQKVKDVSVGEIMVTEGSQYLAMHKLEGEDLLQATTEIVDGRARKYYSLTEQGGKEVFNKLDEARAFIEQLQNVLNIKPALKYFDRFKTTIGT